MTDDERRMWTDWAASGNAADVDAILAQDRADRDRERTARRGALASQIVLLPLLLWCTARGVTPLVRGAFALMSVGSAAVAAAEWLYLDWSRQALPGPKDTRSQLQKTAFLLARQRRLIVAAVLWSAPIFVGVALIGVWLYEERTHAEAIAVWSVTAAGWIALLVGTLGSRGRLNVQRARLERVLDDLT